MFSPISRRSRALSLTAGFAVTPLIMASLTGCATSLPSTSSPQARVATPISAPLGTACNPAALQAVASGAAPGLTIRAIPNGPRLAGGVLLVAAQGDTPAYCKVTGSFVTQAATGKTSNFLAVLPADWNGKFLQIGCGGTCGWFTVNDPTSALVTISAQGSAGQIIRKGYAAFSTDQGHESMGASDWAIRDAGGIDQAAIDDFLYRADEALAPTAKAFTRAFYGQVSGRPVDIAFSYFAGCSNGGREALVAAARFPDQFDGIIAGSPAANLGGLALQGLAGSLAMIRNPEAAVTPQLLARVGAIVTANCDAIDGVEDGLIQNPAACDSRPERDLPHCEDGGPTDQCFTTEQIRTVSTMLNAVTDERGSIVQPGFSVSEFRYSYAPPAGTPDLSAPDPWANASDAPGQSGAMWQLSKATLKVFTYKNDPQVDLRGLVSFRTNADGPVAGFHAVVSDRVLADAAAALDTGTVATASRLAPFIRQDRKLLLWLNLSDQTLTPYMVLNLYKDLAAANGGYGALQDNVRLFALPGTDHCSMAGIGPTSFDALSAVEDWVERQSAPQSLIATLKATPATATVPTGPARQMPLCAFPAMARFRGEGDVAAVENWSCPAGDTSMIRVGESGRRAGVRP